MPKNNNSGKALKTLLPLYGAILAGIGGRSPLFATGESDESYKHLTNNRLHCYRHNIEFDKWYKCKDFVADHGKQKCCENCVHIHKHIRQPDFTDAPDPKEKDSDTIRKYGRYSDFTDSPDTEDKSKL